MNVFDKKNIILNASPVNKTEAIKMVGQILLDNGYIKPEYIDDMMERENIMTTYIGNNVAIPHGLSNSAENILHSGLAFIQVPNGVEFGTPEESLTAYLIIGIAGKNGDHLDMLANLAMVLTDMDKIEKMRSLQDKNEIIKMLEEVVE